jgi:hypothetical protein
MSLILDRGAPRAPCLTGYLDSLHKLLICRLGFSCLRAHSIALGGPNNDADDAGGKASLRRMPSADCPSPDVVILPIDLLFAGACMA